MQEDSEKNIKEIQEKLNKISRNCDICKAKMCGICSNSKIKKSLKLKLKDLGNCYSSNTLDSKITKIIKKVKSFFNK